MEGNHEHKAALPNGTRLRQYRIEKVLGVGSFGVTYLAHDNDLQSHFAIKEYIPNEFALREGATVHPKSSANEDDYRWGLSRFLQEARELAKFRHANIVRVHQIFEENNTAYMVLDFEEGVNFDRWLKNLGRQPAEKELRAILSPLLDALEQVHANGLLHRDIAPDNIIIHPNGKPVLLDFGSARQAMGMRSKSVSAIVKAGYSPPEQYSTRGEQGAYTDIYALSATMYRAINGAAPPEGSWRMMKMATADKDPMTPLQGDGYSPALRQGIERGLAINAGNRPQTVAAWREILSEDTAASSPAHSLAETKTRKIPQSPTRKSDKGLWLGWCAAVLLIIVIFAGTENEKEAFEHAKSMAAGNYIAAGMMAVDSYLSSYPDGQFIAEAKELKEALQQRQQEAMEAAKKAALAKADKEAFERAKSTAASGNMAAGIAAVNFYLTSYYPDGQFIDEARELREALQQQEPLAATIAELRIEAAAEAQKQEDDQFTILHYAAGNNNNPEIIAALLNAGANIHEKDKDGDTPLHIAAIGNNNPEIIAVLLNAGANIHEKDNTGNTPLHYAAGNNDNPAIIAALLNAGANIHEKNKSGDTPLHEAAWDTDNPEIIAVLLNAGANIHEKNNTGNTPLHYAAGNNDNPAIIAALLNAGANVNEKDKDGDTPLHEAVWDNYNSEIIAALLNAGANVNATNSSRQTPLDIAPTIINAIRKAGGQ